MPKGGKRTAKEIKQFLEASYQDKPPERIDDWVLDKKISKDTAVVYHNSNTGETVVAHRGTKGLLDWGNNLAYATGLYSLTNRYKKGKKVQKQAEEKYGKKNISTLGHSQGAVLSRKLGADTKEVINVNPAYAFEKPKKNEYNIRSSTDVVSGLYAPVSATRRILKPKHAKIHDVTIPSKSATNVLGEHSYNILERLGENETIGSGKRCKSLGYNADEIDWIGGAVGTPYVNKGTNPIGVIGGKRMDDEMSSSSSEDEMEGGVLPYNKTRDRIGLVLNHIALWFDELGIDIPPSIENQMELLREISGSPNPDVELTYQIFNRVLPEVKKILRERKLQPAIKDNENLLKALRKREMRGGKKDQQADEERERQRQSRVAENEEARRRREAEQRQLDELRAAIALMAENLTDEQIAQANERINQELARRRTEGRGRGEMKGGMEPMVIAGLTVAGIVAFVTASRVLEDLRQIRGRNRVRAEEVANDLEAAVVGLDREDVPVNAVAEVLDPILAEANVIIDAENENGETRPVTPEATPVGRGRSLKGGKKDLKRDEEERQAIDEEEREEREIHARDAVNQVEIEPEIDFLTHDPDVVIDYVQRVNEYLDTNNLRTDEITDILEELQDLGDALHLQHAFHLYREINNDITELIRQVEEWFISRQPHFQGGKKPNIGKAFKSIGKAFDSAGKKMTIGMAKAGEKVNPFASKKFQKGSQGLGTTTHDYLLPAVVSAGKPIYDATAMTASTMLTGNPVLGKAVGDTLWNEMVTKTGSDPRKNQKSRLLGRISGKVGQLAAKPYSAGLKGGASATQIGTAAVMRTFGERGTGTYNLLSDIVHSADKNDKYKSLFRDLSLTFDDEVEYILEKMKPSYANQLFYFVKNSGGIAPEKKALILNKILSAFPNAKKAIPAEKRWARDDPRVAYWIELSENKPNP